MSPSPKRRPRTPPPPRAPRFPPIRLAPIRSQGSVELDSTLTRSGLELPPFVRWDRFMEQFRWKPGEHITTIGPTGSGKTILNRILLQYAPVTKDGGPWVVVLGIKNRDAELYGPFEKQGYQLVRRFNAEPPDNVDSIRLLFVPQTEKQGREGRQAKSKAFRQALNDIQDTGYWCVYADDVQYMSDQLGLREDFEELWMIGRSEGISVVASSQEPVNIPVMAYNAPTHLFLFSNPDLYRARRMAELTGMNREVAQHTILELPEHEFLYIQKNTRVMLRSKVIR